MELSVDLCLQLLVLDRKAGRRQHLPDKSRLLEQPRVVDQGGEGLVSTLQRSDGLPGRPLDSDRKPG